MATAAKAHRDQYLAVRCNPANERMGGSAGESGSYKAEDNEYVEDICPYATFQLNKQTYSESSYSGNVYSGPYHSVRGSFVYHDVKTDTFQVGVHEMRMGNRLFMQCTFLPFTEQGTRVHESATQRRTA